MNALLEQPLPEDHSVISPDWVPLSAPPKTFGLKKKFQPRSSLILIDQETYDNIKTKGTDLSFPEEESHLEQVHTEILNIRTDVAEMKAEMRNIKDNTASIPEMVKDVAGLKSDVTTLKTDVAELKTSVAVLKTDVAEFKTDVAVIKTDIKYITENTQQIPNMATDIAVIKNSIDSMKNFSKTTNDILIALLVTIVGGIAVWVLQFIIS